MEKGKIHVFAMLLSGEGRAPSDEVVAKIRDLLARNGQRVKEAISHSHEKKTSPHEVETIN